MDVLQNLTVLSLEQALTLPYLTYRLAQEGMEVIRLEHPKHADPNRRVGQNLLNEDQMYSYYLTINSGKKALTLNLAEEEGQNILYSLIKELNVDIFATNQLPKNYKKLGIDYETLRSIKPDLIWLGVSGFGPQHNEAAYDPILQARSGLMDLTGERDGDPQVLGVPLPDMGTSEHSYGLIMKSLFIREKTGQGSCLHMSMFESSVSWLTIPFTIYTNTGIFSTRRGNTHEFFCPVSVYKTQDGYVYLAIGNNRQWKSLVSQEAFQSLDKPEYEYNEGRINDVERLNQAINEITQEYPSDELISMLNSLTIPVSKIRNISEVKEDPLLRNKFLSAEDHKTGKTLTLAPPPYITPFMEQHKLSFPPRLGEHNQDFLCGSLGYSQNDLRALQQKEII